MTDRKNTGLYYAWTMIVLIISMVAVLQVVFEFLYYPQPHVIDLLTRWDYVICCCFFADFLLQLLQSKSRMKYLMVWGVVDLLSCIPVIQGIQALRLFRVFRLVKAIRSLRYSFSVLLQPGSILLMALTMVIVLWFLGALLVLCLEAPESNATIATADDALWWGVVTLATVGYGDYTPLTFGGRIVGSVMMTFGVITYGVLTGFIVSYFTHQVQLSERSAFGRLRKSLVETNARLERLEKTLERIESKKSSEND